MPCKILSLDGGGSWALLEAQALGELYGYDTPGQDILGRFALAAGNSGGSIVLAALVVGFSPRQIIQKLNDLSIRQSIFVKKFFHLPGLERYDTSQKLVGLKNVLQKGPLGDKANQPLDKINPPCKLLIPSFNYDRMRADFFRSDTNSPAATMAGSPQPTLGLA